MILVTGSRLSTAKRGTTEYRENTITIINKEKTDRTIEVEILMFSSILYSQKKYWMRHKGNRHKRSYQSKLSSILKGLPLVPFVEIWAWGRVHSPQVWLESKIRDLTHLQQSRIFINSVIYGSSAMWLWLVFSSFHFSHKLNTNNFFFFLRRLVNLLTP